MNKILSISAIMAILSLPAFATIQSGSTCDTTNLGQSENNSTANVEADWTANTINIDWWDDEDAEQPYASTTCTYDGTIQLPADPTKTGYTFNGWVLRQAGQAMLAQGACQHSTEQECLEHGCVWENNACRHTSALDLLG